MMTHDDFKKGQLVKIKPDGDIAICIKKYRNFISGSSFIYKFFSLKDNRFYELDKYCLKNFDVIL